MNIEDGMKNIAELMKSLAARDGVTLTDLSGVAIYKLSQYQPPTPVYYQKGIVIVGQGPKTLYLGDEKLDYDEDNYIVFSLPLPVKSEIFATADKPHICLFIGIDMGDLSFLIDKVENHADQFLFERDTKQPGFFVSRMTTELKDAAHRLLKVLHSPLECAIMGEGLKKEILYRVLCSENAASLYSLMMKNSNLSRVERAVKTIHSNYAKPISVDELAALVNMSTSAFHRAFKDVTTTSPIQYIKKTRLDRARELFLMSGTRVGETALAVGYESATQFSREFKRYFGSSPAEFIKDRN